MKTNPIKARMLAVLAARAANPPRGVVGRARMDAGGDLPKLMAELKGEINNIAGDVKRMAEDALKEAKNAGSLSDSTKKSVDESVTVLNTLRQSYDKLAEKITGFDASLLEVQQKIAGTRAGPASELSIGEQVANHEDVKAFAARGAKGNVRVVVHNAITSVTGSAGDLIIPTRIATPIELPRREVFVRDLLSNGRTTSNMIEFVRETGFTNLAAVVSETTQKPESGITFEPDTAAIRTIAHWVHVSRQAMDDVPQLQSIIDTRLRYGLDLAEEAEILSGDGTGIHMLGIIPQATVFDRQFVVTNRQIIDDIRLAMLQVELALYSPDGIVMNPIDWAHVELTKDANDLYILSNPRTRTQPTLWGLPVVSTTGMDVDEFLVGAFRFGATYWTRMDVEVLISSEDRDNFIKNMLTVRAEKRGTVTVYRPEAFVYGRFNANT